MGSADWIERNGPVIACYLTPTVQHMEAMRLHAVEPERIAVRLMVDTGARGSALSESLLRAVGARFVRTDEFLTVHHNPFTARVFRAAIEVLGDQPDHGVERFSVDFAGLPEHPDGYPYEGVLGRDFLRGKQFIYDGVSGKFGVRLGSARDEQL